MLKSEILEFLELPATASEQDIHNRAFEKKNFFQQLQKNAPNTLLKNLYAKNLEKIEDILNAHGNKEPQKKPNSIIEPHPVPESHKQEHPGSQQEVAWLIRHTESMATKSFPLFTGKNLVGREKHPVINTILLHGDEYISRQHAVIEISAAPLNEYYISDGLTKPSKNGIYLNGNDNSIEGKVKLHNNDTIQIGMTKLTLRKNQDKPLQQIVHEVEESDYMKTVIINFN